MKIKVCGMGMNWPEVAELQPDYLGLIFWEPSKRYFSSETMGLVQSSKFGVFVDAAIPEILEKTDRFFLDGIQLHGRESPGFCADLKKELDQVDRSIRLIKAFAVSEKFDFRDTVPFEKIADFFLFDAKGELPGGNSIGFNWNTLQQYEGVTPYFLSGGIGPEDLDRIVDFVSDPVSRHCHAIDINSRFELKPGLKDIAALKPFIQSIRKLGETN